MTATNRTTRRLLRLRAIRAYRAGGSNRADARRAAFKPAADAEVRRQNTTDFLRIRTAIRLGIPLLAEKDGARV